EKGRLIQHGTLLGYSEPVLLFGIVSPELKHGFGVAKQSSVLDKPAFFASANAVFFQSLSENLRFSSQYLSNTYQTPTFIFADPLKHVFDCILPTLNYLGQSNVRQSSRPLAWPPAHSHPTGP